MSTLRQTRKYKTHTYIELFDDTEYFCPNCGEKNVYAGSEPDYYQGVDYFCMSCDHSFTMPSGPSKSDSEAVTITWENEF